MQVKVTFKTTSPLSSETGHKFWRYASHFNRVVSPSTYEITLTPVSSRIQEGIDAAVDLIEKVVGEAVSIYPEVTFLKIHADMEES